MRLTLPDHIPMSDLHQFAEAHGCVLTHTIRGEIEMHPTAEIKAAPITYPLDRAAKMIGLSRNEIYTRMRDMKFIDHRNLPYQRYIDSGHLKVDTRHYHTPLGLQPYALTLVTVKGLQWLREQIGGSHHET